MATDFHSTTRQRADLQQASQQHPAVVIVHPAQRLVVLRQCADGYSQGTLKVQIELHMGEPSPDEMGHESAEFGSISLLLNGEEVANSVLYCRCPASGSADEEPFRAAGRKSDGTFICDKRANPSGEIPRRATRHFIFPPGTLRRPCECACVRVCVCACVGACDRVRMRVRVRVCA